MTSTAAFDHEAFMRQHPYPDLADISQRQWERQGKQPMDPSTFARIHGAATMTARLPWVVSVDDLADMAAASRAEVLAYQGNQAYPEGSHHPSAASVLEALREEWDRSMVRAVADWAMPGVCTSDSDYRVFGLAVDRVHLCVCEGGRPEAHVERWAEDALAVAKAIRHFLSRPLPIHTLEAPL